MTDINWFDGLSGQILTKIEYRPSGSDGRYSIDGQYLSSERPSNQLILVILII